MSGQTLVTTNNGNRTKNFPSFNLRNLVLGIFYVSYLLFYRLFTDTFVYRQAWQFIKDGSQGDDTKLSADPEFIIPIAISGAISMVAGIRECMVMHRNLQLREAHEHEHSYLEVLLIAAPNAVFATSASLLWQDIIYNTFNVGSQNVFTRLAVSLPQAMIGSFGAYYFHMRAYEATRQDAGLPGFWSHYNPRQVPARLLYYTWTILISHFLNGCIAVYLLINQISMVFAEGKSTVHDVAWWLGTAAGMLMLAFPHALVEGNTEARSLLVVKRDELDKSHHCLSSPVNAIDTAAGINHSMTKAIALPILLDAMSNMFFVDSPNSTQHQTSAIAIFFRAAFFLTQGLPVIVANTAGFRYSIKYSLTHLEPEEAGIIRPYNERTAINSMETQNGDESNATNCCFFSR